MIVSLSWLSGATEQSEGKREMVLQVLAGQEELCLSRKQKGNVWTKVVGVRVCVCVTHSLESVQECVMGWPEIAQGKPPPPPSTTSLITYVWVTLELLPWFHCPVTYNTVCGVYTSLNSGSIVFLNLKGISSALRINPVNRLPLSWVFEGLILLEMLLTPFSFWNLLGCIWVWSGTNQDFSKMMTLSPASASWFLSVTSQPPVVYA